jgi:hypothetical protein
MDDVQRSRLAANYATMESALILLASGPANAFRVFAGEEEAAYRAAFGAFVAAWGPDTVWFDPEARIIGSDGGVTLGRWRAHLAARPPTFALVVTVAGAPADIYLVDGPRTAERIWQELSADEVAFVLVELERLEPVRRAGSRRDPEADMRSVRVVRGSGGRPARPRARRGDAFCPRCQDQRLHSDAMFDSLTAQGLRVCGPCGTLARLRRPA